MKKVKYFSTVGMHDNIDEEFLPPDYMIFPQKSQLELDTKSRYSKCPALKEWGKNTWIFYQPFDLEFKYISARQQVISNNLHTEVFNNYIYIEPSWLDGKNPNIQLNTVNYFWTDEKDVWIEQIPHPLISRYGIEVIPGTFPISVWHRPVVCGCDIIDHDVSIKIPRGTPLFYIRFYSQKSNSLFDLERKLPPEDFMLAEKQDTNLKKFTPFGSWDVIQDRLKKEESSCPFNFLRRK